MTPHAPRLAALGLLAVLAGGAAAAQVPGVPAPVAPLPPVPAAGPAPTGLTTPAELEAFLDGIVAAQKESNKVSGMAVAVVAGGRLFLAKGYGLADRAAGKPVDAERTLFRIGSVSKLFTWTAVMQLVDEGRLDLDTDVNEYLAGSPVRVPDTYAQPVTMTHLLTHTAGFEDLVVGLFARSPEDLRPLGDLLAGQMPARVRRPGILSSYSNHGVALAAYVVERIAGIPWERYVEERILRPLEMTRTTVRQPVPQALAAEVAAGYRFADGEYQREGFEFVPAAPAGGISASAVDMSRFMLAHLQDGRYGDARILSVASARRMRERLFGHATALNGMLHGFIEMNRNGRRIYGHGGDTLWFHSELALMPDEQVGLFVSCNSQDCARPRSALLKAFVDRYFPATASPAPWRPVRTAADGSLAGSYRSIRMPYRSLARVAGLVETLTVTELPDGRLRTSSLAGPATRWVPVAPLVFRNAEGDGRIAFLKGSDGRVTHLAPDFPAVAFERQGPLTASTTHLAVVAASLLLFALAIVAWPIAGWRRWRRRRRGIEDPAAGRGPWVATLALWLAAVLLVAFVVLAAVALADPMEIVFGVPGLLRSALALPIAAAALTAVSLVFAWLAWSRGSWRFWGRVSYTLVAMAATAFLAVLWYWNLLGYHLG